MKVGVTLPQFRHQAGPALDTARRAEAAGLDGVFVFDHLWPLGRPDRPALHCFTLVAALIAETERLSVGTLVARVGVLPDAVLAHTFATLHRMAGDRLVAGLGVGDAMSRAENLAVGVPFRPRTERLASLVEVCRRLRARGVTTWVGGTSRSTRAIARSEADGVNVWGVSPEVLAEMAAEDAAGPGHGRLGALTWAGQVDLGPLASGDVAGLLQEVAAVGATWAVVAPVNAPWPEAVESIAAAAGALVD